MVNRMELRLSLNVKDSKWKPGSPLINDPKYGLQNLPLNEKYEILTEFTQYLADKMSKLLYDRIKSQYQAFRWAPLSEGYKKFKKSHNLSPNIWEATGYLAESIIYYKRDNYYVVGIAPNKRYPNSKTNVLFVAKCMEFGTRYMPARPLFGPVIRFMRRNVRKYWELFLNERGSDKNAVQLRQSFRREI